MYKHDQTFTLDVQTAIGYVLCFWMLLFVWRPIELEDIRVLRAELQELRKVMLRVELRSFEFPMNGVPVQWFQWKDYTPWN